MLLKYTFRYKNLYLREKSHFIIVSVFDISLKGNSAIKWLIIASDL
ncbi:hypothetical protein A1OE_208 [Candidatus Endolissoclinum faulkneri L2]|uniref:Uncharacterized protein n=1 Tax=Candidatus Endolissoclinum faulkneri L2 TaxID=1193729 RepID=K7YFR1_9PROT|nr:hypothetical protein A1OE_208 [Candidatus Endolissoclinum faulkneri L2]